MALPGGNGPLQSTTTSTLESAVALVRDSGRYTVLERFSPQYSYGSVPVKSSTVSTVFVDCETTGTNASTDCIIQLSVLPFILDRETGEVLRVEEPQSWYQDPGLPIPPEVVKLTGITDDMVNGQRIDDTAVSSLLVEVELIVAHNAQFDRAFIDARLPHCSAGKLWACSMQDIPWAEEGIKGRSLDYLLFRACGIDLHGHMADVDAAAGLQLLQTRLPVSGRRASEHLLEVVYQPRIRIDALYSPFEKKDLLKVRGYQWDPSRKVWWTELPANSYDTELTWLTEYIYDGRKPNLPSTTVKATDRHRQHR